MPKCRYSCSSVWIRNPPQLKNEIQPNECQGDSGGHGGSMGLTDGGGEGAR